MRRRWVRQRQSVSLGLRGRWGQVAVGVHCPLTRALALPFMTCGFWKSSWLRAPVTAGQDWSSQDSGHGVGIISQPGQAAGHPF